MSLTKILTCLLFALSRRSYGEKEGDPRQKPKTFVGALITTCVRALVIYMIYMATYNALQDNSISTQVAHAQLCASCGNFALIVDLIIDCTHVAGVAPCCLQFFL